jgi:hypothetical protein
MPGVSEVKSVKHVEKMTEHSGGAVADGHASDAQSNYFKTIKYTPAPLPVFEKTKAKLPSPIYEEWEAGAHGLQ